MAEESFRTSVLPPPTPMPQQEMRGKLVGSLQAHDPIVPILAWFASVPDAYREQLFRDFEAAAQSRDMRQLLDTLSDWAATAEVYASPALEAELREAIGGREGAEDWLPD